MEFDIIIAGGTVFSGDLEPGIEADVGIKDGRIVTIGRLTSGAHTNIDAHKRFVAPGFIDIHSHSDYTLLIDPRAMSAIHQGVTLEVIGNCGFGCAPVADPRQAMQGIYGFDNSRAIEWRDFAGYFDALEAQNPAVNVMCLAPLGQIRRASGLDLATPTEADGHRTLSGILDRCLEHGCCGLSTGLEYSVERFATEKEVTVLASTAARAGGLYATHTRARGVGALPAIEEAIRTARAARVQLQISHLIPRSTEEGEIETSLMMVDAARKNGLDVGFDMHTRAFGTTMLNTLLPPWVASLGDEEKRSAIKDEATRARMREFPSIISSLCDWSRVILLESRHWPEYGGQSLAEISERRGRDPFDCAFDLLEREESAGRPIMVILPCYSPDQQATFFSHPDCIPASDATTLALDGPLSDAVFHGAYSWAAWFYRFMVRERRRISPAEAIHRLTGKPARVLGLKTRGRLAPGMAADVAIFDPQVYGERSEVLMPNRLAAGMSDVIVNGVPTLRHGAMTGQRAGHLLRGRAN
jgi:N-acyl-D-amino-acid deacylase